MDDRKSYKSKNETSILSGEQYIQTGSFNVSADGGIYKIDIIKNNNLRFNETIKYAEDQLFILSFIKKTNRIMYKDIALYYYYQHPGSAVHNYQSDDMLLSCKELIKISKSWPVIKEHIDNMIVEFVIKISKNNDIPYRLIEEIYKKQDVKMNSKLKGICKIFYYLSKLNFTTACFFTFIYLKIRLSFTIKN